MNQGKMESSLMRYTFIALILTAGLFDVINTTPGFLRDKVKHNSSRLRLNGKGQDGLRIQPAGGEQTASPTVGMKVDSNKIIPVIYDDKHCQNGGTGYLGSFCLCPPLFTGRYCETDIRNDTTCGRLSHMDWTYRNCNICVCNNGLLLCELFELKGCRDNHKQSNGGMRQLSTFSLTFLGLLTSIFSSKYCFR
ncbi:Cryptic protein [Holothuria leucospilota]|uniref:Cryptic protein n=1 Tax=Holothuria leucospilota TaxID=206669 RepID=A0A9Q1C6E7_HOLLE|nr:Cryptic protein [Holothuria leucospilota]